MGLEHAFLEVLLRPQNLFVMASIMALLETAKKTFPALTRQTWFRRALPAIPAVWCLAIMALPPSLGIAPPDSGWLERLMLGAILGPACTWVYDVYKQVRPGTAPTKPAR